MHIPYQRECKVSLYLNQQISTKVKSQTFIGLPENRFVINVPHLIAKTVPDYIIKLFIIASKFPLSSHIGFRNFQADKASHHMNFFLMFFFIDLCFQYFQNLIQLSGNNILFNHFGPTNSFDPF